MKLKEKSFIDPWWFLLMHYRQKINRSTRSKITSVMPLGKISGSPLGQPSIRSPRWPPCNSYRCEDDFKCQLHYRYVGDLTVEKLIVKTVKVPAASSICWLSTTCSLTNWCVWVGGTDYRRFEPVPNCARDRSHSSEDCDLHVQWVITLHSAWLSCGSLGPFVRARGKQVCEVPRPFRRPAYELAPLRVMGCMGSLTHSATIAA